MILLEFLEVSELFRDFVCVEYLCHALIMPSPKRNGIRPTTLGCVRREKSVRGQPTALDRLLRARARPAPPPRHCRFAPGAPTRRGKVPAPSHRAPPPPKELL